jgi:hypothetical protein
MIVAMLPALVPHPAGDAVIHKQLEAEMIRRDKSLMSRFGVSTSNSLVAKVHAKPVVKEPPKANPENGVTPPPPETPPQPIPNGVADPVPAPTIHVPMPPPSTLKRRPEDEPEGAPATKRQKHDEDPVADPFAPVPMNADGWAETAPVDEDNVPQFDLGNLMS